MTAQPLPRVCSAILLPPIVTILLSSSVLPLRMASKSKKRAFLSRVSSLFKRRPTTTPDLPDIEGTGPSHHHSLSLVPTDTSTAVLAQSSKIQLSRTQDHHHHPPPSQRPGRGGTSFLQGASGFSMGDVHYLEAPSANHITLNAGGRQNASNDGMSVEPRSKFVAHR